MRESGFTLIEVVLSVVIIGMLTAVSLPVYESFVRRNDLDLATQNLTFALRRAQTYARGVSYDSAWGVGVQSSNIVLFRGATYASRNAAFDETISIPGSITSSGLTEIRFAKFSAAPHMTGTFTLTSTTNDVRTVAINAEGVVTY